MLTVDFKHIPLQAGDSVLDLGCGEGRHAIGTLFHAEDVHVVAVDLSFNDLSTARQRHGDFDQQSLQQCLYTQANGLQLPFANHSFDHIICSEVLEHIHDYQGILQEIHRVLKPGGSLNVSVPRFWPEKICWMLSRAYHQVEGGHIRIFNSQYLRQDIQKLAFDFKKRHWAHALHVPYWWLRCAFWQSGDNFFLTKWYHKILVWDLLKQPRITRFIDKALNPFCGKSVVMYFTKR